MIQPHNHFMKELIVRCYVVTLPSRYYFEVVIQNKPTTKYLTLDILVRDKQTRSLRVSMLYNKICGCIEDTAVLIY